MLRLMQKKRYNYDDFEFLSTVITFGVADFIKNNPNHNPLSTNALGKKAYDDLMSLLEYSNDNFIKMLNDEARNH